MPFGVTNGVAGMQRVVEEMIEKENCSDVYPYVDNITICGNTREEHDKNLLKFKKAAEKYRITFNEDKSIVGVTKLSLLGYVIEKGVVKPDADRFQALDNMGVPWNLASQRRIVGLFSYYSK